MTSASPQRIGEIDPTSVEMAPIEHELIVPIGDELVDAYVAAIPAVRRRPDVAGVPVAYTAMHGVGGEVLRRAFDAAGLPVPHVVDAQFDPDGTFPTVSFPNPEEPGAMDLLLDLARSSRRPRCPRQRSRCRPSRRGNPAGRWFLAAARRRRDRLAVRRLPLVADLGRRPLGGDDFGVVGVAVEDGGRPTVCTRPRPSPASSGSPAPCSTTPT